MIVKILSKSGSFNGVRYSTNKVDKDKGELLLVKNFGLLQGINDLRPQDYINYLKAVSSANTNVKYPQLHVAISCKGRESTKDELASIAETWLDGMGYGKQPYLIIYHKDTMNNHIHIVSTRVARDGKKIPDSFEKIRSYQLLNQILHRDESQETQRDIMAALSYNYSTRAQFMMILEGKGYSLALKNNQYAVCKYGKQQGAVDLSEVDKRMLEFQKDRDRIKQLRAIILKYNKEYSSALYLKNQDLGGHTRGIYSSSLAEFLNEKFGLQILFHAKGDKPPYGYTIIDHAQKAVFKGGDIKPIAEFILQSSSGSLISEGTTSLDNDYGQERYIDLAPGASVSLEPRQLRQTAKLEDFILDFDIAADIDDEAVHCKNRERHRKSRSIKR